MRGYKGLSRIQINMREQQAVNHRISKGWKVFHKWREILVNSQANIKERIQFWHKTVGKSMTWALETARGSRLTLRLLKTAQRNMTIKMMGQRRKWEGGELEPWLQYFIRINRDAKQLISKLDADVSKMLVDRKITFAQHVSRFAIGDRETHLVKQLLMWRPLKWWRHQQESIKAGEDFFRSSCRWQEGQMGEPIWS